MGVLLFIWDTLSVLDLSEIPLYYKLAYVNGMKKIIKRVWK